MTATRCRITPATAWTAPSASSTPAHVRRSEPSFSTSPCCDGAAEREGHERLRDHPHHPEHDAGREHPLLVAADPEEQAERRPGVRPAGIGDGQLDHGEQRVVRGGRSMQRCEREVPRRPVYEGRQESAARRPNSRRVASVTPQPRSARPPLGEPTDVGWEAWAKLGLAVALAALAVAVVPRGWDGEGSSRPSTRSSRPASSSGCSAQLRCGGFSEWTSAFPPASQCSPSRTTRSSSR